LIGGGCITDGKYNMTAKLYTKDREVNPNTGQVKNTWGNAKTFNLVARGLANLRGKDSGTIQDFGNKLVEYHYLRVKTMQYMDEGQIIADIKDSNGQPYLKAGKQFVVIGVTPTFDPFGSFIEYDILCDEAEIEAILSETLERTVSDVAGGAG
jgi:hypothetical protein